MFSRPLAMAILLFPFLLFTSSCISTGTFNSFVQRTEQKFVILERELAAVQQEMKVIHGNIARIDNDRIETAEESAKARDRLKIIEKRLAEIRAELLRCCKKN